MNILKHTKNMTDKITALRQKLEQADAVIIGADDCLYLPDDVTAKMSVSDEQIPRCLKEIEAQSICIDEDIGKILSCLLN